MKAKQFEGKTHLIGEVEEAWLAFFMCGYFANSHRCDLPTRRTRLYFNEADSYEVRGEAAGHEVSLVGFDPGRGSNIGRRRSTFAKVIGFQVRQLTSFTWRFEGARSGDRCEIAAERIDNNRWKVSYLSDVAEREIETPLSAFVRMIDPDSFQVIKIHLAEWVACVAGKAAQIAQTGCHAFHPEVFRAPEELAGFYQDGVRIGRSSCPSYMSPRRAEVPRWWQTMLDLPVDDEEPSWREGHELHAAWILAHTDIVRGKYGSNANKILERARQRVAA